MTEIWCELKKELQELKNLTLLGAKKALRMNDAALLTGLSENTLYKMVHYKEIPYYKSKGGKMTYFDRTDLDNWMLSNRFKSLAEIDNEAVNYCLESR